MQNVQVLQSAWSSREPNIEVPIVGSRASDDRVNHNGSGIPATVRLSIGSDADIVVARQHGRALANAMSFSATDSAFIATTVSELARALLSHTSQGEISLHRVQDGRRSGVVIEARDPLALDHALPDVFRLVDEFDIASEAGRGTTIRAAKWCRRR